MARITNFGSVDSLQNGEQLVPLVVVRKDSAYHGFVPGLIFNYVEATNKEECFKNLKEKTLNFIKTMIKEEKPFPFFPNKKEIMEDFESVVDIKFIKIFSAKRASK